MEQTNGVTVKGTQEGLMVQVSSDSPVEQVLSNLKEKFTGDAQFFQNAELVLDLGMRPLQEDEFRALREVFDSSGIRLKGILSDNPITKLLAQGEGITLLGDRSIMSSRVRVDHPVKQQRLRAQDEMKSHLRQERQGLKKEPALFVHKTVRAGQKVHFHGDITVLGDVNPGAEVVAVGNIAVFGALRGVAHAGAEGKSDAVVVAIDLKPTQLRISDCIARAPEKSKDEVGFAELARIQEGKIVIERYEHA